MTKDNWLYQVWVHRGQESAVHLVETCQERWRAEKDAGMRNATERHDTRPDRAPRCYYYVKPVTEGELFLAEKEQYRKSHGEYRKQLAHKLGKVLKPLTREMATAMVFCIETCERERLARLRRYGGWIDGYRGYADGIGDITCSLLYSGMGEIALEVAVEYEGKRYSSEVETFSNEHMLRFWLLDTRGASSACENSIVCTIYDMVILRIQQEGEDL